MRTFQCVDPQYIVKDGKSWDVYSWKGLWNVGDCYCNWIFWANEMTLNRKPLVWVVL